MCVGVHTHTTLNCFRGSTRCSLLLLHRNSVCNSLRWQQQVLQGENLQGKPRNPPTSTHALASQCFSCNQGDLCIGSATPTKKEALCFREFLMGRNLWYRSTGGEQPHGSSSPHTTCVPLPCKWSSYRLSSNCYCRYSFLSADKPREVMREIRGNKGLCLQQ